MHIQAHGIAEDGRGVALHEGSEIRVFDLLPGEEAIVEVEHSSRNSGIAWARIVERIGPLSPWRTAPACPAYGLCGGCAWQHMRPEEQSRLKRERVTKVLQASLGEAPAIEGPAVPARTLGYRNKGKYVFGYEEGRVLLGAYRPRSHTIVSTLGCQVVEAAIDRVAHLLRDAVQAMALPVYSESGSQEGLRYAVLRSNARQQVFVVLVCTSQSSEDALQALADELDQEDAVCGVLRCDNDLKSGAILTAQQRLLVGGELPELIAGVELALGGSAFFQLNRELAEGAYGDLCAALGPPGQGTVIELYSGVGGIAFTLARAGHRVLGIEIDEEAVRCAQGAARAAGLDALVSFRVGDATSLRRESLPDAHTLVVDPPRKGLGKSTLALITELRPQRIAYLSCGPESLAADLLVLCAAGYRVELTKLYDFMPGTAQVESLVVLTLAATP